MNDSALPLAVLPPDTDRRRFLGGSDAAAIMGLGAFGRTPYTTWLSKTSDMPEEVDPEREKFFRRRKRYEQPIIEMLREEFGGEIVAVNQRYIDPEHDFLAAEIDFEWVDPEDGSIQNGEIKTVHPLAFSERNGWGQANTDEIPIYYAAQVMHGLGVLRRRKTIVAALAGFDNMVFYQVLRDEETIAAMRAEMVRFWVEHVLPRIPPDPQTARDIALMTQKFNGRPVELDDAMLKKLADLAAVRANLKAMKDDEEALSVELGRFICKAWGITEPNPKPESIDNAVLQYQGSKVGTWKKTRGAHLDQKKLKIDHPEIISEYTVEHWYRPFRITI